MGTFLRFSIATAVATVALALPLAAGADATKVLKGVDGPGFTITMTAAGHKATIIQPGNYTITIFDKSNIHNFHLKGPGVNKMTGIAFKGEVVWHLKLKTGTYTFVCDPHASIMKGTFRVTNL